MNNTQKRGKQIVQMTGIEKAFPGVKALDKVDFDLYEGEVLALLGENGAGKSTLVKILSGVYQRDAGSMKIFGEEITGDWNTNKAQEKGIAIIHQEMNLCPHLSVAENIFLGRELTKGGKIDNEQMHAKTCRCQSSRWWRLQRHCLKMHVFLSWMNLHLHLHPKKLMSYLR